MYTVGDDFKAGDTSGTSIDDLMEPRHSRDSFGYDGSQQQQQQQRPPDIPPGGIPVGVDPPSRDDTLSDCALVAIHIRSCPVCSRLYRNKLAADDGGKGLLFYLLVLIAVMVAVALVWRSYKNSKLLRELIRQRNM